MSAMPTPCATRRRFLAGTAALSVLGPGVLLPRRAAAASLAPARLVTQERPRNLPGCSAPSTLWTYGGGWPLVLRIPRGEAFSADLENRLAEHTTIHWHGVRVPFAMDGVPYITQPPVEPGETFRYSFTPPDPGTFFFHPHCNTAEALGRGLAGVMIVEDPRDAGRFDVDEVLALKDWRVREDGSFEDFITDAGAAKAGSFGRLRTVNGGPPPILAVAPNARVRLRLVNLDSTRIVMLNLMRGAGDAAAAVIATDGNACDPFALRGWRIGPAMRADVAFIAPAEPGVELSLLDVWPATNVPLARIITAGTARRGRHDPSALRLPPAELPEPDLAAATRLDFTLLAGHADPAMEEWAKEMGVDLDSLCIASRVFWSINRTAWPGASHERVPPPLFELMSGRSYVAEIFNGTPHRHPMHLHGHTFRVIGSSKEPRPPHWADTVLVDPKERVQIAFVAGEPGDWMFHCHIIEHQETGMMGYLRVT
jgi:FtsP/CotA-like multicopper oxidase with cupredoxin domain